MPNILLGRRSAVGGRRSAVGGRRSAVGGQRSAVGWARPGRTGPAATGQIASASQARRSVFGREVQTHRSHDEHLARGQTHLEAGVADAFSGLADVEQPRYLFQRHVPNRFVGTDHARQLRSVRPRAAFARRTRPDAGRETDDGGHLKGSLALVADADSEAPRVTGHGCLVEVSLARDGGEHADAPRR
ncbi:UNVERIFIED_ORG: hypothetical protein E4P37_03380 [Bacillus sp. AZ43]